MADRLAPRAAETAVSRSQGVMKSVATTSELRIMTGSRSTKNPNAVARTPKRLGFGFHCNMRVAYRH